MAANVDKLHCKRLLDAAKSASTHAYCPYSNFAVGAAVITVDGDIFIGVNVENASYGLTLCAERAAIVRAICELGAAMAQISAVAVVAEKLNPCYPCGACLQVIAEFATPDCVVILYDENDNPLQIAFRKLLPFSFELK